MHKIDGEKVCFCMVKHFLLGLRIYIFLCIKLKHSKFSDKNARLFSEQLCIR